MNFPTLEDQKGNFENFLVKVEAWFKIYDITKETVKIFILGNHLTDSAGVWWANKLRADPTHDGIIFRDWELFCRRLREQFGQQDRNVDAFARLYHLRMLDDSPGAATKYVERFRDLMIQAGLPEDSKTLWMFQKGLTQEMIRHFERDQPEHLYQWYEEVTRIGRNKEALARLRRLGPDRPQRSTAPAGTQTPIHPGTGIGVSPRPKPLPPRPSERPTVHPSTTLSGPRMCFNCGKAGHMASACTAPRVPRVFFAGEDQTETEDEEDPLALEYEDPPLEEEDLDEAENIDEGNGLGVQH
jgi:hypothetical protein